MDALTKPKRKARPALNRPYPDLHDHMRALDKAGLLITVDRPINKDTEMHPLVRWQFRGGIAEKDRKAFLFTNVVDGKGRKYDIPVLVGGLAANREIYRIGMGCPLDEIDARWVEAARHPIPPRIVENAPCQEIVITGKALDKPGNGLDGIPLPISTPGWDIAPYATLSQYITKDPDTGDPEHGQLPRPGEGAAAARHEPVARTAARHLHALGKVARARLQEAAVRGRARRAALRHLHLGAEAARERSTSCTSPARWSARRSTS